MQVHNTKEFESTLRSFEQSLEQALEDKDWDRMISVNQELQNYFQFLSNQGVISLPSIQKALTRVRILLDALIQVCIRHRSGSLAMIKQTQKGSYALARYEESQYKGSMATSGNHHPIDYYQES
ncbi:MAG: hypothetical protein ACPGEF_06380 [Endozoicomonas sp.]